MSIKQCCSLCCTTCGEYKLLQNDLGESNEVYEITVKYFDPMLLQEEEGEDSQHNQALCQNCWFHIEEFHEFQQTVLKARMLWEDKVNKKQLPIEVKQEDEQPYVSTKYEDEEQFYRSDDDDDEDHFDDVENYDLKTESLSSLEDVVDSIAIQSEEKDNKNNLAQDEEKNKNELEVPAKSRRGRKPRNSTKSKEPEDEEDGGEREKRKKPKLSENKKEKGNSALNMEKAKESDAFIAEWKPELICDLCSESANNFDKLRSHFREKHKTRFYIKCCERKFFRRCVLVNHIQLHLNPETHKCDICGKSSSTKHNLKLHKKVMHEDTKQLKCDICEKLFKQKVTLERHLLTHSTGSKDFVCSECGKGYVAEQLLKLHIKHVHNVDRVCDQCGKTIHGFQALKKHLMEHAGIERPTFRCDICGVELKSPNGLKRHKAAYHNDGTTIYVCGVCGKVASSENALLNHKKLVHVVERKHKCTYCDKAFKRPKSLREHIATHTGQDLYQCPHCPQTFRVSANMHHHRKKVHPVEWQEGRKNRLQQPKININQVKKQVII
ncbi:transcription factor grauzone-like [Calliphora vicina]|uniref:transcription factor grauzone-like n=1 Tax=Calliphora vicina TaxID=7373 RepID=UPI00325B422A